MAAVIEMNIKTLKEQNKTVTKFDELAKLLTGSALAKAEDVIFWADNLVAELKIPSLSKFGLTKDDFPILVQKAKNASSMKGNPVELSTKQLKWILEKSL
jgi:alcohol dehydrogenase class IV